MFFWDGAITEEHNCYLFLKLLEKLKQITIGMNILGAYFIAVAVNKKDC